VGSDRGFTFIEVLVVMVVLSLGVLGALQTTLLAARIERRSSSVVSGTFLAQERLERIAALGWERATADLAVRALPASLGAAGVRAQEELAVPGGRFLLVFERENGPVGPPLCTVSCYWADEGREYDQRNAVRLSLRRRR
jgi:prepilin-type N-terminal cleavage/methylation domain-containing protein